MSISKDAVREFLDSLCEKRECLEDFPSSKEDDFGNIKRISFIDYKGMKGRLIWDCDYGIFNELTFIENITGKHFSLGKTKHDKKMKEIFYSLAQDYGIDDHKCVSKIVLVYDSEKAKESARKLCKYIRFKKELNTVLLHEVEYKYLKKKNQVKADKEIILGHHSSANDMIRFVDKREIECGMSIGYDSRICVLMAERNEYPWGKSGKMEFGLQYQKTMKEFEASAKELDISLDFDENEKTTVSMYNFLLTAFVETDLDYFLALEYEDDSGEKSDELCNELQTNPICKRYITSDILEKILEVEKFLENKGEKTQDAWADLCILDDEWHIQRYWIKDYCRVFNSKYQKEAYGTVEQILCPILEHCHREELKEKIRKRDWGIVFCGGGGKGAYQLGVWKWLIEHGIADKITGISGASVGALNSLLFVEGNYDFAKKTWDGVKSDVIFKKKSPIGQDQDKLEELIDEFMGKTVNIPTSTKLVYSAVTCVNGIPWKTLLKRCKKGVAPETTKIKENYFCWASREKEEIKEIVLASAAIPVVKKKRQFEGKQIVDGGFADNVPVRPLVEDGFRNIIIVYLDNNEEAFQKAIAKLDIKNVKFHHVWPSEDLGKMTKAGTALTKVRIELGYKDAASQLKSLL